MVTKLAGVEVAARLVFESCVVLDGDKTMCSPPAISSAFESCVVLDGDKTCA